MTELALATVRELSKLPALKALLGSDESWETWIFPEQPYVARIEGTQKSYVVVNVDGSWADANRHNTLKFPRLIVDVWADPTRDLQGNVKKQDATEKIIRIGEEILKLLHDVGNKLHYLDDVRVVSSRYLDGYPDINTVTNGNGVKMGTYTFGLELG